MAVQPQYQSADRDEPDAGIGHKRIGINEGRSDKDLLQIRVLKPKNASRRQSKREKTVSSVGTTDRGNRPEEEIRPRGISAELNGNPQDACRGDKPQERQGRQIAINSDASINRLFQRMRAHLPYGVMQPGRGPGRILD